MLDAVSTQVPQAPDDVHGGGAAPLAPDRWPEGSWAAGLLATAPEAGWREEGERLLTGLGAACLFGAALGLKRGGAAIALHAVGAAAGILAVALVAVPSFAILLALANAPIGLVALGQATTRAAAKAGLLLGGLAPAAALYVVTAEDELTLALLGLGGLWLSGAIAARSFREELRPRLAPAPLATRQATGAVIVFFLLFSAVLATRVWCAALPILTPPS